MKTKKLNKKLFLNKKTIVCLKNGEMKVVKVGGNPWIDNTVPIDRCPTATIP